jgi:hypothetical protein
MFSGLKSYLKKLFEQGEFHHTIVERRYFIQYRDCQCPSNYYRLKKSTKFKDKSIWYANKLANKASADVTYFVYEEPGHLQIARIQGKKL